MTTTFNVSHTMKNDLRFHTGSKTVRIFAKLAAADAKPIIKFEDRLERMVFDSFFFSLCSEVLVLHFPRLATNDVCYRCDVAAEHALLAG